MELLKKTVLAEGAISLGEDLTEERYVLTARPEGRATLKEARAVFAFSFQKDDALFVNGYQSWTYSPERGVRECDKAMKHCPAFLDRKYGFSRYGDGHFYPPAYKKGVLHGYTYAYVRRGEEFILFGSTAEKSGFTRIVFDTRKNTVTLEKDCAGREIEEAFSLFDLRTFRGTEDEVFDRYFAFLGVTVLPAEKASGYTSWYNCYQDISEARIESDLEGLKALPRRPDFFQIDDGFESFVGDWLTADKAKFPNGTAPVCEKIRKEGYRAGIWLAPFVCEKASALYRDHPEWLLKDGTGAPVYAGSNWSGAYALDFYCDGVRDYVRASIETYKKEGFTLFKLDFLYAICMPALSTRTPLRSSS